MNEPAYRNKWGFVRRPIGTCRDRSRQAQLVFDAKQAVAAVPPDVTSSVLEFALFGAGKARAAEQRKKPKRRRKKTEDPEQPKKPLSHREELVARAHQAISALPRQSMRDELVEWAMDLGIGK